MSVCDIKGQLLYISPILSHGATKANISITLTLLIFYVSVHPTDTTRLELIIPGEQHFYVRAVNAAERQRWLVALGSSKAGTLDSNKHKGKSAMSALFFLRIDLWKNYLTKTGNHFSQQQFRINYKVKEQAAQSASSMLFCAYFTACQPWDS